MNHSFYSADAGTHLKVVIVGLVCAALVAGTPFADVFCPGCRTSRSIDLRAIDRHPLASVGSLVLGLRCSWCRGNAPMPKIAGLYAVPQLAQTKSTI